MSDKQTVPTGVQLTAADPVFREHPHEYLDRLRTEDPVHRDAELGRLFLTWFEEARMVVSNRALSVDPRKAPPDSYLRRILAANEPIEVFEPSMLSLDDPHHKRIRGLVSQVFNQRAVDAFRPRIRAIAEALLDALSGRDTFDVIAEYAAPLPTIVIAEMLGRLRTVQALVGRPLADLQHRPHARTVGTAGGSTGGPRRVFRTCGRGATPPARHRPR
jgi:cytochrome P450